MISKSETALKSVILYTKDKSTTLDIFPNIVLVTLHESIFSFTMSGTIGIIDADNIFNKFNLADADCMVQINIASANDNKLRSLEFYVDSVTDFRPNTDNTVTYNINLQSIEVYADKLSRISKGYCGTKQAIIGDIMSGLSNKPYISINMEDENKLLCPYMHPFDCIDLLLLYGSNVFDCIFWENIRGFNLNRVTSLLSNKPIHSIYESQNDVVSDDDLIKNPENITDQNRISSYFVDSSKQSRIEYLDEGISGSVVQVYDSLTGLPEKFNFGDNNYVCKTYIHNNTNLCYQYYGNRRNILSTLSRNRFSISVKGDINRSSGDSIFVEITNGSIEKQYNKKLSGSFIITDIVHKFMRNGYIQNIKVSK